MPCTSSGLPSVMKRWLEGFSVLSQNGHSIQKGRAEILSPPLASLLFVYVKNIQVLPILFLVNLPTREASPEQVQRRVMTSY